LPTTQSWGCATSHSLALFDQRAPPVVALGRAMACILHCWCSMADEPDKDALQVDDRSLTRPQGDIAPPVTPVEQGARRTDGSQDELVVDDHSLAKAHGDAAEDATRPGHRVPSRAADQK
jgi:hypothetical protein